MMVEKLLCLSHIDVRYHDLVVCCWGSGPRSTDFIVHRSQVCETFPFTSFYFIFSL